MQLSCVHCGKRFTIKPEQLGGKGRCPHCNGEISLPKAESPTPAVPAHSDREPGHWLTNSISGLISLVVHMVILLVLALVTIDSYDALGEGDLVAIGQLPSEQLSESPADTLEARSADERDKAAEHLEDLLVATPPVAAAPSENVSDRLTLQPVSPSSSGGGESFDLGSVSIGGGDMGGGSWDGMLQSLRRNGLDIVITFDSTGSMGGEIDEVKRQIRRIGTVLFRLVPQTRLSVCTYRDRGDEYIVKGVPLTGDLAQIDSYLSSIVAGGGGDQPEAVEEGLRWAVTQNQFRSRARKVILLFGDAPPHSQNLQTALAIASDFHRQQQGVVSTVSCRSSGRMKEFAQIAEVGGGEAFLTSDERQIMTQLMVLVFGSQHRAKVLEAFELLGR